MGCLSHSHRAAGPPAVARAEQRVAVRILVLQVLERRHGAAREERGEGEQQQADEEQGEEQSGDRLPHAESNDDAQILSVLRQLRYLEESRKEGLLDEDLGLGALLLFLL